MCMMNWLNKVNAIQTTDNSNIVKKSMTRKLKKLKRKLSIMIMTNILLL